MRASLSIPVFLLGFLGTTPPPGSAWEAEEHRLLADSAFAAVLKDFGTKQDGTFVFAASSGVSLHPGAPLWKDKNFGELCAFFAREDLAAARFQERGKTVLQQLAPLSGRLIEATWQARQAGPAGAAPVELADQNVIANYLLHHLIALRFARLAAAGGSTGREALVQGLLYEAMAQGYLGDAFSASHLLVPRRDRLAALHPVNNREAHHFYRTEGAYVVNATGEAWRTFGDRVLHWYAPTYRHVLEACITSLREFFLAYFVSLQAGPLPEQLETWALSIAAGTPLQDVVAGWLATQDGPYYYAQARMPALLLVPMPVSATWSIRTADTDDHGIRRRKHVPQLRDAGLHDPDLQGLDPEFLYPSSSVPAWLIPDVLRTGTPEALIRSHPDVASVRFIQERDFLPSYKGLLLRWGGSFSWKDDAPGVSVGLGYGLWDNLLVIRKVSLDASVMRVFGESRRTLLTATAGLSLPLGLSRLAEALRLELGYALASSPSGHGSVFAVGLEPSTIPLGFTYAGLTMRLKYQWIHAGQPSSGPALEFAVH